MITTMFVFLAATVIATGDGVQVSRAALEEKVRAAEFRLQTQQYELQRKALAELLNEQLLAREAKARGVSTDELRRVEIESQLVLPPVEKLNASYEKVKGNFPGVGRDELIARITKSILQPKRAERESLYFRELARKYHVKVDLEPPRYKLELPPWIEAAGNANAPVTVVVFSDFECAACRTISPVLSALRRERADDVRVALVNYPLKNHDAARYAALGMVCAQSEGRFWPMYDELFKFRPGGDGEWVVDAASVLNVDVEKFRACLKSEATDARLQKEMAFAERVGIAGTPTIFVNGRMFLGAPPPWALHEVIDEEIAAARRPVATAGGR